MGTLVLVGLLVAILLVSGFIARKRQATATALPDPSPETTAMALTPLDSKMAQSARTALQESFKKPKEIADRLVSNDSEIVKVTDDAGLVITLQRPTSKAWVAIIRDKGDEHSIWFWLPNLRGMPNLFTSTYDKDGNRKSGGAILHSSTILGEPAEQPDPVPLARDGGSSREPFGWKSQWLAIKTTKPEEVARLLKLKNVTEVEWNGGVEAAYSGDKVFISPPIGDWVLALDTSWVAFADGNLLDEPDTLARWSATLRTPVQHFVCDRRSGTYGWMNAEQGKLVRAFLEVDGSTKTDLGAPDAEEQRVRKGQEQGSADEGVLSEGEDAVFRLAQLWSVDPHQLDQAKNVTGGKGLVGDIPE